MAWYTLRAEPGSRYDARYYPTVSQPLVQQPSRGSGVQVPRALHQTCSFIQFSGMTRCATPLRYQVPNLINKRHRPDTKGTPDPDPQFRIAQRFGGPHVEHGCRCAIRNACFEH